MGRIKKEKTIPVSLFYLKYFIYLFAGLLIITAGIFAAFNEMYRNNMVYRADYAQELAEGAYDTILAAEEVTGDIIPELCQYALFDPHGRFISGDIEENGLENAWKAAQGLTSDGKGNYYKVIPRETEYCVLRYRILPQYRSPFLRRYLISPQNLLFTAALVLTLLLIIGMAICFGRALKKKLHPLISATEKIQKQELDFDILSSDIKEINTVLNSMDKMRAALKESLEKQWKLEQSRKEQMSALAHDLKTPLTLVRGNADLLYDTQLTDEQREYTDYIANSSMQMQNYVQMLIEAIKSENVPPAKKQRVSLDAFLRELKDQARGLCAIGRKELRWDCEPLNMQIEIEPDRMARALINVLTNAAEHTPDGGAVCFEWKKEPGYVAFIISDAGAGFSKEALLHAKEQFFMDDLSRASRAHYGMGLYIADTIVKQHNGTLELQNSEQTHGAKVILKIPC